MQFHLHRLYLGVGIAVLKGSGQQHSIAAPQVGSTRCRRGHAQSSWAGGCPHSTCSSASSYLGLLGLIQDHVSFLSVKAVHGCTEQKHVETIPYEGAAGLSHNL